MGINFVEYEFIKNFDRAKEVFLIQKKSYLLEANVIKYNKIPPLLEQFEDFLNSNETFVIAFDLDNIVGVVSFKIIDDIVDIYKVFVNPNFFRKKIASKSIQYILAKYPNHKIIVSTASKNYPAVKLYESLNFKVDKIEVKDKINLVSFTYSQFAQA